MDSTQIQCFLKVVEVGSYSKAATLLYTSKSTISKKISQLEYELGFPLFYKSVKGTVLSEKGKEFYQDCLKMKEIISPYLDETRDNLK